MHHQNSNEPENESQETIANRRRWSTILLTIFTAIYAGFIALCAFANQWFTQISWLGVPAPVWYGLFIIFLALAIAGLYGHLTRSRSSRAS